LLQSYIPLYRKYRPQTFKDLVGQEALSQTLTNAILNSRVAHAYLFTGPRGTGKTSTARILAKSLNCEKGPTPSPCGICSSCMSITSGNALDVIEIDAASNRSVEDARDLIDRVQFAPVAGRYKVYIIDEVHMLTSQAFNTLLKTLEEPPPNLVFILATTEAHKVLETIISRCQRFDFRRISQDAIVKRLIYISEQENIKITKEALNMISRRSAGGMRDAVGLLDQISVLSTSDNKIEATDVLSLLGALPEDMLIKISEGIANRDGAYVLSIIKELINSGSEPLQIVKELTIHFRNLLIAATVKENINDIIDASEEFFDKIREVSALYKQIELAQIIDKLSYCEKMVRNTSQPMLWLEVGILSITYRHEILVVEELQKRVEELEKIVLSGQSIPVTPPKKEFKASKTLEPVANTTNNSLEKPKIETAQKKETHQETEILKGQNIESVDTEAKPIFEEKTRDKEPPIKQEPILSNIETDVDWDTILNAITNLPTKGMLASLATPFGITSKEVVIGFSQATFIEQFKQPNRLKPLEDALLKVFGEKPRITLKLISTDEAQALQNNKQTQPLNLEKKMPEPVTTPKIATDEIKTNNLEETKVKEAKIETKETKKQNENKIEENAENSIDNNNNTLDGVQVQFDLELSEQAEIAKDIFQGKILNHD